MSENVLLTGAVGTYQWRENWITIPNRAEKAGGRTHGTAVSREGTIFIFHQANPAMLVCSPTGKLLETWGDYEGAHGLTLVQEQGREFLWLTDEKRRVVHKTDLHGRVLQSIECPPHPAYSNGGKFIPTQVAVNETRFGGNGEIWVTDGYGANLVHRFDASCRYIGSISGEESGLPFRCPHGIALFSIRGRRELWVADRSNRTIQIFDESGCFQRRFGADYLISPNGATLAKNWILIPELSGRLTAVDFEGGLLGFLGENQDIFDDPQWPDAPACGIVEGRFNSPHFASMDSGENIFVGEWILGGRVVKLEKVPVTPGIER
jgi:hypothetical protein